MKRLLTITGLLIIATTLWGASATPYAGSQSGGFVISVVDSTIGTTPEIVDADTGFTQQATDTTFSVSYLAQSYFDSIRTGMVSNGNPIAVWSLANTADSSGVGNPLINTNSGAFSTAVFGNGYSTKNGISYLSRDADTDFNLGTTGFTVSAWFKTRRSDTYVHTGSEAIFSMGTTPDELVIQVTKAGGLQVRVSDDGTTTEDTLDYQVYMRDGNWHHLMLSRGETATNDIDLYVDGVPRGLTVGVSTLSAAVASLDPDTVWVGAFRGASIFDGQIDEVIVQLNNHRKGPWAAYEYNRGEEAQGSEVDTARVFISGIKQNGQKALEAVEVPFDGPIVTSNEWKYFENAWVDSAMPSPLVVFTTGTTVRTAKLDSIAAGRIENSVAHYFFGPKKGGYIQDVDFYHLSSRDTTDWTVRVYQDIADSRDLTDDYQVIARARLHANEAHQHIDIDRMVPNHSYIAVFSNAVSGSVSDIKGQVILRGSKSK